jgi:hypothetical protein
VEAHIKERAPWFHRFDVTWTPTVLIFDSKGAEKYRMEGYLPQDEFQAQLEMGLGRIACKEKRWAEAGQIYRESSTKSGVGVGLKDVFNTLSAIDSPCGSPRRLPDGHPAVLLGSAGMSDGWEQTFAIRREEPCRGPG